MNLKVLKIIILAILLLWFGLFLAEKIDLTTADIGRHIKNGELIMDASWQEKIGVLHTNFYSYTAPSAPFINHHWGSGLIFYLIWKIFGFSGLSVVYVLLGLLVIFVSWLTAKNLSNFWIATFSALLFLPLIVSRVEVRPEIFTYLFSAVFLYCLCFRRYLWVLPLLMFLWVNLHIGFVFGFLILGAFLLFDFKKLLPISAASVLTGFINPFGYQALLYPLNIFKNYGYRIVENQSVSFLENLGFGEGMHFGLFKITLVSIFVLATFLLIKKIRLPWPLVIVTAVSGIMAYLGIRHFPSFAIFALPLLSVEIFMVRALLKENRRIFFEGVVFVVAFLPLVFQVHNFQILKPSLGFGLLPKANASAEFFKENNISGPVFNNYDIGGYLIFHLFPKQKVFTDNRPEAYPEGFFEDIYIKAQEDEEVWQNLDRQYSFNAIFFSHRDHTPWGQKFLVKRVGDPAWAPVLADSYNIIFLKRSEANRDLIDKHEISKSAFGISTNQ